MWGRCGYRADGRKRKWNETLRIVFVNMLILYRRNDVSKRSWGLCRGSCLNVFGFRLSRTRALEGIIFRTFLLVFLRNLSISAGFGAPNGLLGHFMLIYADLC